MSVTARRVKVSKGYQITVPSMVREKYGIKDGDNLLLIDLGTEMIIRIERKNSKLTDLIGKFSTPTKFDVVKELDETVTERQ